MGRNAIFVFLARGMTENLLTIVYWTPDFANPDTKENILSWIEKDVCLGNSLTYVLLEVSFFLCMTWQLGSHNINISI